MLVNLSVWESKEALWRFVYDSDHLAVMRRRREWFTRLSDGYLVLWWILAGSIPFVEEAQGRLAHLQCHGPPHYAFNFKQHFAPPARNARLIAEDHPGCPV